MRKSRCRRTTLPAVGVFAMLAATAATAADTHPCAAVTDATARLACFDAAFVAPATSTVPAPAPSTAAAPVVASAAVPVAASAAPESFGFNGNPPTKPDKVKPPKVEPPSITSTIVSVSKRPYGELVLVLDNGQVWTQLAADPTVRLREGDTVTIRAAALGSYLLVSGSNATKVKRIR